MPPFGLLAGLGAAVAWGTMDIASALSSRRLGSLHVTAGIQVVAGALIVGVALATGTSLPADPGLIAAAAVLGIAGAAAYLTYFTGLRIGPISVVSGMVAAYGGLTVILAVTFRGESLSPLQAVGAAVATGGVVMTALAFDGTVRGTRLAGPGVAFALVALILFSVMTIGLAAAIEASGWLEIIVVSRIANASASVVAVIVVARTAHPIFRSLVQFDVAATRRVWWLVVLAGVLDAVGVISYAIGLERAATWLVGLASSFGPAVTIVIAVLFLGERLRPIQWIGLLGIGIGMVAIAVPS